VVTVDATGCAEACAARVHMLKQVHTSINKDMDRVQRVLLVPADTGLQAYTDIQKKYPDLVILAGSDAEMVKFSAEFDANKGNVFLVDPLGNLMMSYPDKFDPKGLRSDLTRLLKNSWAG
jgi:ABC-type branched-subunit amino acid transport system substrate-binding protein